MTIKPRNFVLGYLLVSALLTVYSLVTSGLGLAVMAFIAFMAVLTIVGVMWLGSQENLDAHAENSKATQAWKEREERVNAARQSLVVVAEGGESGVVASSTSIVNPDDAEARRQAALARKAARATKTTE